MTVSELIELLEDFEPNTEVRLAQQPSWPFEYTIAGVVDVEPEDMDPTDHVPDTPVVYVVEGTQIGYAAKAIWDRL